MVADYHYDALAAGTGAMSWASRLDAAVGDGHASCWLLLVLLAVAVPVDFRAQQSVLDTVPPPPGVPRWAGLARTARGSVISARLRWPARTMRGWLARRWAGTRVATADAFVAASHEIAFLLIAAGPGGRRRSTFAVSLAFTRQRRELAMRAAGASDRAGRDVPRRARLWAARRVLTETLALGGGPVVVALLPHAGKRIRALQEAPGLARRGEMTQLLRGELASGLGALHSWFSQFTTPGQVLIVAAGLSVLVLLVAGWTPPMRLSSRPGAAPPSRIVRCLAGVPAPGQLVLDVFRLTGALLPSATVRLLRGRPVAQPYQRLPPAQQALSPVGPVPATLRSAAVAVASAAGRRRPPGGEPGRGGWQFPPERVRRWLGHAPEFGVGVMPASGDTVDAAEMTADLTKVLCRIAEAADSLRLDQVRFRDHPARAVVDRATGAAVFFTPADMFAGCALLTEEQLFRLVTERRL